MNLAELQADLRHFAAERGWQSFHTPKNLSTALMVEAAELAEIFQWMTPEESRADRVNQQTKERIGEEVADVLLYLLQVADHSQVDISRAVKAKLASNALRYPAKHEVLKTSPPLQAKPSTHVLLDYENVQPTEAELRAMVPNASHLWVFHGAHQRQVARRFSSFGGDVVVVPISKAGNNALDFHLTFYVGYIASKNPASEIVVVANDKGYDSMLKHGREMGLALRRQGYGNAKSSALAKSVSDGKGKAVAKPAAKKTVAVKTPAKKVGAKHAAVKAVALKNAPGNKLACTSVVDKVLPTKKAAEGSGSSPALLSLKKITESLLNMPEKRPVKPASLRRALKFLLGAETGDESIELALEKLISEGVVLIAATGDVTYPGLSGRGRRSPVDTSGAAG